MPTYDQIRIQSFLAERVDLKDFCFVLVAKFRQKGEKRPQYAFQNLAGAVPAARSRSLVQAAFNNHELGELVFQLAAYWLERVYGNAQVLVEAQLHEELIIFRQELLDKGNLTKAEQVLILILKIKPDYEPPDDDGPVLNGPPPGGSFEHGYAVLIGVGEHRDARIPPLPATVKDPHAIREVLVNPARCAYLEAHVHLVTGPGATRQSILEALDWLADRARQDPRATAIFYFSGHGWKDEEVSPPRYCLIPYDCDWQDVDSTTIGDDLFTRKLSAIPIERLVIILDACHAGGMTKEAKPLPAGFVKAAPPTSQLFARLGSGRGKVILSSSRENEFSHVRRDNTRSIFTDCLIEALSGRAASSHPAEIGIIDVFNYLDRQVPAAVEAEQYKDPYTGEPAQQHPVLDSARASNFPIALSPAGRGQSGG